VVFFERKRFFAQRSNHGIQKKQPFGEFLVAGAVTTRAYPMLRWAVL
jgi:hypothetical protein